MSLLDITRNLVVFQVLEEQRHLFGDGPDAIAELLAKQPLTPCKEYQAVSWGWVPPFGDADTGLVHDRDGVQAMMLGVQEKLMPGPVINDMVDLRARERLRLTGHPCGQQERRAIREDVIGTMLPHAFTRTSYHLILWDRVRGLVMVCVAGERKAETVIDRMRQSLGQLKLARLSCVRPPAMVMTRWLARPDSRPDSMVVGDTVELHSNADGGTVRARDVDVDGGEVHAALAVGRQVSRLGITLRNHCSLVLDRGLLIRQLRFDDDIHEHMAQLEEPDEYRRCLHELGLVVITLRALLDHMTLWFGGAVDHRHAA